jgi:hypothetical protein
MCVINCLVDLSCNCFETDQINYRKKMVWGGGLKKNTKDYISPEEADNFIRTNS